MPPTIAQAIEEFGFPVSRKPPDEELIDLLVNAAEIEHGLLVQYLYAAASTGEPEINAALRLIAIEEMGHFITVQNLLLAFGAAPHLNHADWTAAEFFQPFPFRLEQASKLSLAKYTIAEMPDHASPHLDADQKAALPSILTDATASAGAPVQPHRVGLLYAKIYWLLRESDEPLPRGETEPWADFPIEAARKEVPGAHVSAALLKPASFAVQAVRAHWKRKQDSLIVDRIASRADARAAVAALSAQGEGFGISPDGHFDRFVKAWKIASVATAPIARDVAVDPWYDTPGAPSSVPRAGDPLTNPTAAAFARLSDRCYEIVVLSAALDLLLAPTAPEIDRQTVASASIKCMKDCLQPVINVLVELPVAKPDAPGVKRAGAPYMQLPLIAGTSCKSVLDRIRAAKDEAVEITSGTTGDAALSIVLRNKAKSIATKLQTDIWDNALATIAT